MYGCDVCSYDSGERICNGLCTADEDQAEVERKRAELRGKVLALLPRHYDEAEQKAVEEIVTALMHVVIGDMWYTGFSPFRHIGEIVKPLALLE
jgi:hypothetical protein